MSAEQLLAAAGLAVCLVLLVRGVLRPGARARLDAIGLALWQGLRRFGQRLRALWQRRKLDGQAGREAEALIERAKRRATGSPKSRDNVIRPRAFKGKRSDDTPLH